MKTRGLIRAASVTAVVVVTGCGPVSANDQARVGSQPSATWSSPSASPQVFGLDLHHANWKDFTVPGAACGLTGAVRLRHGVAHVDDPRGWSNHPPTGRKIINIWQSGVYYGTVEGPRVSDAVLSLYCDNNGGTADGQLEFSLAVFSGKGGERHLLGLITPQVNPRDVHVTLMGVGRGLAVFHQKSITVKEAFYGRNDATCCPSGRATTTWTYDGHRLLPGTPHIIRQPKRRTGGLDG